MSELIGSPLAPIRKVYGGHLMRSLAEVGIATLLDVFQIPWSYEPLVYQTRAGRYVPDFRINEVIDNLPNFIEVKPYGLIERAAEVMGMDGWHAALTPSGDCYCGYDSVMTTEGLAELFRGAGPLSKPYALACEHVLSVWVMGKVGANSLTLQITGGGGVVASRQCVLYQADMYDRAYGVLSVIRNAPSRLLDTRNASN
jgi:hypothetical protein